MKSKGTLVTALIVLTVIFTAFNWGALSTYLPINFLFFQVQLPLGLFLIGAFLLACLLFLLLSLFRRAGQLRDITRMERQLDVMSKKLNKNRSDEIVKLEEAILERLNGLETRLSETDSGSRNVVSEHTSHIEAYEPSSRSGSSSGSASSASMSTKPDIAVVDKEIKRAP